MVQAIDAGVVVAAFASWHERKRSRLEKALGRTLPAAPRWVSAT